MQRWIAWGAVIALLGFGCGDDDGDDTTTPTMDMGTPAPDMDTTTPDMNVVTGSDYERTQEALEDLIGEVCACDTNGFTDAAECVAFQVNPAEVQACEGAAVDAAGADAAATYTCLADAYEAYASCYAAAACDADALDACGETADAAFEACPEIPETVFGDDFITCVQTGVLGGEGSCPEGDASSALGEAVFSGNSLQAGFDFELSCAGDASPDRAFQWTAPEAGAFTFDTDGSSFDTLLAALDTECAGEEVACNDDSDDVGPLRSSFTLLLEEGDTVILVVAGYDYSAYGDFQINISMEELTEPDPMALTRERAALDRADTARCACDMGTFETTDECEAFGDAPATYESCVDTAYTTNYSSAGSPVTCQAELAETYADCVEAAGCDSETIDNCEIAYVFSDECLDPPAAYGEAVSMCADTTITGAAPSVCPENVEGSTATGDAVFSGTTVLGGDDLTLSCGSGGSADRVYQWTATDAGTYVFDTAGSTFDTVLALQDACDGADTACNDDAEGGALGTLSSLTATLTAGQTVFVVVEGYSTTAAGEFQININAM